MFCGNCGHTLKKSDKFCESCGTPSNGKASITKGSVQTSEVDHSLKTSTPLPQLADKQGSITKLLLISLAVIAFLGLVGYLVYQNGLKNKQALKELSEKNLSKIESEAIEALKLSNLKAVVNIACDNDQGGSGTIVSKEGLVLTNHHVVSKASLCLISLPDTTTGEPIAIYQSKPVVVPGLSEGYDIAMLNIDSSYTDEDGKTWGSYPTGFPSYTKPDNCDKTTSKLGDSLKIYGYPVTSGGANLTVTEGIISSFSDDGNILTSAKIDSGNSGGFAVDFEGCFIGIPSAVVEGNYQNFGVIISGTNIQNFVDEVPPSETSNKYIEDIEPAPQAETDPGSFTTPSVENSNPESKIVQPPPKPSGVAFQSKLFAAGEEYVPVANYFCNGTAITRANELLYYSSFAPVTQAIELLNSSTFGTELHDLYEERYYQALADYNDKVRQYNNYLSTNCSLL
jgi:S1-C subfamily serine protease